MTTDNSPRLIKARNRKRAVTDEAWIRDMLRRAPFGVLATAHEGQPYAKPSTFAFDEAANAIYLHGAKAGRTPATIEHNDRVCFCVGEMGRLLPAESASEFGVEYSSVIAFGRVSIVDDEAEARRALQMLLDKYFPHLHPERDYPPLTDKDTAPTAVYRIQVEEWSGKQATAGEDFPGAFEYGTL